MIVWLKDILDRLFAELTKMEGHFLLRLSTFELLSHMIIGSLSNGNWSLRILYPENLRFPPEGSSAEGKSGPKMRLKSVIDG